jgi:hypothetical protein
MPPDPIYESWRDLLAEGPDQRDAAHLAAILASLCSQICLPTAAATSEYS